MNTKESDQGYDQDCESAEAGEPIEIQGESPHFVLHNGRGRLELFTRTRNGALRFTTIMLTRDGRLHMTNETGSRSVEIHCRCRTQIGRNFQGDLFNGYVGHGHDGRGYVSGNHCELVIHDRGAVDSVFEMGMEISIRNGVPPPTNGTYYKYYES